ncbi:MAG: hypothetical protein KHY35_15485 [Bacteroides thetaiotaomicron]|uniref:Major fimbrial subunit protein N-terminal domain-containing protein n=1 Tax=Bacteroides thetaiotaomicron TaxID=818 RepID=A0A943HTU8_BACT4|nr:hypothetical protein [Bacteroides thetaiotaomicron]
MEKIRSIYIKGLFNLLLMLIFLSCIDETFTDNSTSNSSYIMIGGTTTRAATNPGDTPDDYVIKSLRVLAFEQANGKCVSNKLYTAANGDIIKHPINPGDYDFVFLANEPSNTLIISGLDGIKEYTDLDGIAYPERYFSSEQIIPMMQEIKGVEVLPGGRGAVLSDNSTVNPLQLGLDRLAVRIDVVLESEDDLEDIFSGLTFENIPDAVPLTSNYQGTIGQDNVRILTRADNESYFSDATPSSGRVWAKKISRIILPAKELKTKEDKTKAVVLTLDMGNHYSPSCELKIASNPVDYSLPINTMLDFHGVVKEPLEVNIKASKWVDEDNDWDIDNQRILRISHTDASITDFNGARISFSSNMPVVKVLPKAYNVTTGVPVEVETNRIFNSLAFQTTANGTNAPERFMYTVQNDGGQLSGTGYMDLLADGWVENDYWGSGENDYYSMAKDVSGTYKITLSAENEDGSNALQREITVKIEQNGKRLQFYHPAAYQANGATGYTGAFWKDNQYGERIIMGQHARAGADAEILPDWNAWVDDDPYNMVILSTTPSLDPNVGTSNPGNAENFRVTANLLKGEDGRSVNGKGRIYFRVGLTGANTRSTPRYATVKLRYRLWGWHYEEATIYLRQGEKPDYLYSGRKGSRAFAVYNMTHSSFLTAPATSPFSVEVNKGNASEVDFPTKAGAHFQWARLKPGSYGNYSEGLELDTDYDNFGYRALNPRPDMNAINLTGWGWSYYKYNQYLIWDNGNASDSYSNDFEICPTGYHRPNDGSISGGASHNSTLAEANASEWRASIFAEPMTGDGNEMYDPANLYYNSNPPNDGQVGTAPSYYKPVPLPDNMTFGFYADGYFDRRPIEQNFLPENKVQYGVGIHSADPAYWGCLFFNGSKSLFFPAAGRRNYGAGTETIAGKERAGILEHPSGGFYMTASAADIPEKPGTVWADWSSIWNMELSYIEPAPISTSFKHGVSLRCVKNE